jgi:glycerol-3-phosphate dehydrogenase (NAD(P)+)
MKYKKVSIIGSGAWGTAIANIVASNQKVKETLLWANELEVVSEINNFNENKIFLPNIKLSKNIIATNSLKEAIEDSQYIFLVVPAKFIENVILQLKNVLNQAIPIIICSKGIDVESGRLLHQVIGDVIKNPLLVLSGPSFAIEVAKGVYTKVCISSNNMVFLKDLKKILQNENFQIQFINDVIGAELSGAFKNVIAIACGILEGKGLGQNARAVMITDGLLEMVKITKQLKGKQKTIYSVCGVGDLVLTATSVSSRNFSFGLELGKGFSKNQIIASKKSVAEGVFSCYGIIKLCNKIGYSSKVANFVYDYIKD